MKPITAVLITVAAILLFGWLAQQVLEAGTLSFDVVVRNAVHRYAWPPLTHALRILSLLGESGLLAVLTAVSFCLLYFRRRPRSAALLGLTMMAAAVLGSVLKPAFHRPRPEPFFDIFLDSYSFPSGHALGAICFYGTLAAILAGEARKPGARWYILGLSALLIGVIGFSRIYLGVHYPSDVIAGYCVGVFCMGAVRLAVRGERTAAERGD